MKTIKNKLVAVILAIISAITIATGEATVSVLVLPIAIYLFFAKENYID